MPAETVGGASSGVTSRLARVGGEEFAVLVADTLDVALAKAERFRADVEGHAFLWEEAQIPVTVSLGVATLTGGESGAQLYKRTDELLYASKHAGRNRVSG